MNDECSKKLEELSLQIFIEKDKLQKLKHKDSVFTINYINESRNNIIKFDQSLGIIRNSIINKINRLKLESSTLRNENL